MLNSLDVEGSPRDTRVVVAMSGGVDSSVTAALLKAEGYDVVGVTLQLYDHGAATHRKGACCAGQDIYDARAVAERIGIPHYVLDYESRFKETVIDHFAQSYVAGETPVPCIECNQSIKFRDLLSTARELGDKTKAETRELARRFGLPVADKHDSQDICFVPSGRYTEVIERIKPGAAEAGDIVDLNGRVLGRHSGIIHFTVGQRRGLGIAAGHPLYVVRLDAPSRRVVVGPREALRTSRMRLREVNWLGEDTIDHALCAGWHEVFVKVRSTRPPQPAWLSRGGAGVEVDLLDGEDGVSPGQACVFYDAAEGQARVLGGGFIQSAVAVTHVPLMREARVASGAERV